MPTAQTSILKAHVTLGASVGIEYSPAAPGLPETISDQGAAMVVTYAHLTFSWNDLHHTWEFEKGAAQGYYLHRPAEGDAIITDLCQDARLTYPQITREQWLADAITQAIEMLPTQQCPAAAAEVNARAGRPAVPDQVARHG